MYLIHPNSSFQITSNQPKIGNMTMRPQIADKTLYSFFLYCCISSVNFSYWSKFNININTGSGVLRIFAYWIFIHKWGNWNYFCLSFVQCLLFNNLFHFVGSFNILWLLRLITSSPIPVTRNWRIMASRLRYWLDLIW